MNKFNSDGVLIVSNLGGGGGGITNINVSAGTTSQNLSNIVFSNSNKFSFGLNGSTITAVYSGINALGVSNVGNTAGNTGVSTGIDWVIAGSNNITVQQSTVAGGPNTIWITGAAGGGGLTNINVSAGTTSNNLSNLVFSNSNNVSFGLNGSTITATVTVATSLTNINISAGTTSQNNSKFQFVNSNGISFGFTGAPPLEAITASHDGFRAITLGGNTAGTSTFHGSNNNTIFLNGGANITLSGNGSTITIIGAAGGGAAPTLTLWNNHENSGVNRQPGNATLYVMPIKMGNIFPGNMTVSTMFFNYTGTGSTGAAFTRSVSIGFYTMVNSTQLSLAFSASTSWGSGAANASFSQSFYGPRWVTIHSSQWNNTPAFSQTHYWVAVWNRSSSGSQSFSMYVQQEFVSTVNRSGFMSTASAFATSEKWYPFNGYFATSFTTAMPNSLAASNLAQTADNFLLGAPLMIFNNIGSNIV